MLWMPEALIIHRQKYFDNVTKDWREKFHSLNPFELEEIKKIIAINKFSDAVISAAGSEDVREVLKFYKITRDKI